MKRMNWFSRIRPTLKKSEVVKVGMLMLIFIIAFVIRIMSIKFSGLNLSAYDPFFQYRATKYIVENGFKSWYKWHDTLRWFPEGRTYEHHLSGVPFAGAFLYLSLKAIIGSLFTMNVSVYEFCALLPPIMGALSCLVMYYLGKEIGGTSTGLFSAFFLAISGAFVSRTIMGFYDTEMIGIFGMLLTILFFIRAIEKKNYIGYIYMIMSGLSLGYILISWSASVYIPFIIGLWLVVELFRGKLKNKQVYSYAIMSVLGIFINITMLKLSIIKCFDYVLIFGITGVFLLYLVLKRLAISHEKRVFIIMIVGIVSLIVLQSQGFGLDTKFRKVIFPFLKLSEGDVFVTVAEHKSPNWVVFFNDFGFTIFLAIFGAYLCVRGRADTKKLFTLLFFISCMYFAGGMVRLKLVLAIPMALMAGYGLSVISSAFIEKIVETDKYKRRMWRRGMKSLDKSYAVIFLLILFFSMIPTIYAPFKNYSNTPSSIVGCGIHTIDKIHPKPDWLQALICKLNP